MGYVCDRYCHGYGAKIMKKLLISMVLLFTSTTTIANDICPDGGIFSRLIQDVCWDCMLPINIGGIPLGMDKPDGASDAFGICNCPDDLGVPEFGYPLPMWMPARISEVVRVPWCSPALSGLQLQDDITAGMGGPGSNGDGAENSNAFYQYHWFASPFAEMLEMFFIPDCSVDGINDFDLMYMSEIDPLHNDSMLALMLNPEAVAFMSPLAKLWCAADCGLITAGKVMEEYYGCAGCDGSLYPLTGFVSGNSDPVRSSSLITQRVLAGLHRKGLASKTIGDIAMCSREYWPTTPRSQYKASMLFPKAEADGSPQESLFQLDDEGNIAKDSSGNPIIEGSVEHQDLGCCHPLGENIHKWSTSRGGMHSPGKEDFLYLIYRYKDCCVRKKGG